MSGVLDHSPARNARWAGFSVLAAFTLFCAGNALWAFEQPAPGASGSELVDFYGSLSTRIVIGGLLSLFSIALFVFFASALRAVIIDVEGDELLANAAFGGTILGLAAGIGAETINIAAALRAGDAELTEPLALALFDISYVLGSYACAPGFGVLTLAISACALRTGRLLPRWLAYVGVLIGVALITPLAAYTIGEYTVGPPFLLLLILGVRLLTEKA